ncbi:hypothetical protein [Paraburkholderia hayleyella]|uniref:hypothetical protein n=1 Tax=Paraburkholderia hayleyella TaxID=2152889 RepID=UPI001290FE94|nr:hypothetical protein [Paraburkholderia hayleyella]
MRPDAAIYGPYAALAEVEWLSAPAGFSALSDLKMLFFVDCCGQLEWAIIGMDGAKITGEEKMRYLDAIADASAGEFAAGDIFSLGKNAVNSPVKA